MIGQEGTVLHLLEGPIARRAFRSLCSGIISVRESNSLGFFWGLVIMASSDNVEILLKTNLE